MARSSGGGSRSGGSRSSSSSSSRSGGSGRRISNYPFQNSRKFRYYHNGQPHYVYSNVDLRQVPDAKPRWFLIFFYLPFIIAICGMLTSVINIPKEPLSEPTTAEVSVIDNADVFDPTDEAKLLEEMEEFKETTGITTQIITTEYNEWVGNGSLETYSYCKYYDQFNDENCWLLVYSELDDGYGEWYWEGVQGDNTIDVMDVFLKDFNTTLHSSLSSTEKPEVADSFCLAFREAIELFKNQEMKINTGNLFPALFIIAFIGFHSYIMIFAGTRKKYSNKDLEEIVEYDEFGRRKSDSSGGKVCQYCGYEDKDSDGKFCSNCGCEF